MAELFAESLTETLLDLPGDLSRQVLEELTKGERLNRVLAYKEQREIAAAQPERTWMDGLGQVTSSISARVYHYWGQKLGYACWRDKTFRREFLRDNPECRVKSVPRKTSLLVQGRRA